MAKLMAPLMSKQASGKVGQTLYMPHPSGTSAGNRSCNHVATIGTPVDSRAYFKWLSGSWSQISAADRRSWIRAATSCTSARNAYIQHNRLLITCGLAPVEAYVPAAAPRQGAPITAGWWVTDPPAAWCTWDLYDADDWYVLVRCAPSTIRRAQINPRKFSIVQVNRAWDNGTEFTAKLYTPHAQVRLTAVNGINGDSVELGQVAMCAPGPMMFRRTRPR